MRVRETIVVERSPERDPTEWPQIDIDDIFNYVVGIIDNVVELGLDPAEDHAVDSRYEELKRVTVLTSHVFVRTHLAPFWL